MISFSDETKAIDSDVGLFAASEEFPSEVLESIDVEVGFGDAEQGDTLRHSWSESCISDGRLTDCHDRYENADSSKATGASTGNGFGGGGVKTSLVAKGGSEILRSRSGLISALKMDRWELKSFPELGTTGSGEALVSSVSLSSGTCGCECRDLDVFCSIVGNSLIWLVDTYFAPENKDRTERRGCLGFRLQTQGS